MILFLDVLGISLETSTFIKNSFHSRSIWINESTLSKYRQYWRSNTKESQLWRKVRYFIKKTIVLIRLIVEKIKDRMRSLKIYAYIVYIIGENQKQNQIQNCQTLYSSKRMQKIIKTKIRFEGKMIILVFFMSYLANISFEEKQ